MTILIPDTENSTQMSSGANSLELLPVVRLARLLRITPTPKPKQVERIQASICQGWDQISEGYRNAIANAAGLLPEDLSIADDEWVRPHRDGKTPMVDLPRIRTVDPSVRVQLDARVCFAICTDDHSSKVWARVGFPLKPGAPGVLEHDPPTESAEGGGLSAVTDFGDLRVLMSSFRHIAEKAADWATRFFERLVREMLPKTQINSKGAFEVSAVTSRDPRLREQLERLDDYELSAKDLLDEAGSLLSGYIENAGDFKQSLESVLADGESFWFSTPRTIEHSDGTLNSSQMLYLMRPNGDTAQTVGVGYSDDLRGRLIRDSALDVSRWVANRV